MKACFPIFPSIVNSMTLDPDILHNFFISFVKLLEKKLDKRGKILIKLIEYCLLQFYSLRVSRSRLYSKLWIFFHITQTKVKCDHRSKFSNLSNWKEEAWKKSGLQRDSNPWPPRYRCDALPTELWSHTLGARSIYWLHIFPCSEMMWSLYEIIHICTAVVDESEMWSSQ